MCIRDSNNNVYAATYDLSAYNPGGTPTSSANPGWVFGYSVGTGGALSLIHIYTFGKAFGCTKGQPMYPVNSCRVW